MFISPVVFTPQHGREATKLYLSAAGGTLGGVDAGPVGVDALDVAGGTDLKDGAFRSTKKILQGGG